jgi:hypothetical protein
MINNYTNGIFNIDDENNYENNINKKFDNSSFNPRVQCLSNDEIKKHEKLVKEFLEANK